MAEDYCRFSKTISNRTKEFSRFYFNLRSSIMSMSWSLAGIGRRIENNYNHKSPWYDLWHERKFDLALDSDIDKFFHRMKSDIKLILDEGSAVHKMIGAINVTKSGGYSMCRISRNHSLTPG